MLRHVRNILFVQSSIHTLNIVIHFRGCSAEQSMFQAFADNVNEYLRDKVASMDESEISLHELEEVSKLEPEQIEMFQKLASSRAKSDQFLNIIWKDFAKFSGKETTTKHFLFGFFLGPKACRNLFQLNHNKTQPIHNQVRLDPPHHHH